MSKLRNSALLAHARPHQAPQGGRVVHDGAVVVGREGGQGGGHLAELGPHAGGDVVVQHLHVLVPVLCTGVLNKIIFLSISLSIIGFKLTLRKVG